MIAGVDFSYAAQQLTPAVVEAMYQGGIRVIGCYFGGHNVVDQFWTPQKIEIAKRGGTIRVIGFCSGWADPGLIHAEAQSLGVLPCLDVETSIRGDGPWVEGWLRQSPGCGLYGNIATHDHHPAAWIPFRGVSDYPRDPQNVHVSWLRDRAKPACPTFYQYQGSHTEFGLMVDRSWFDDWFLAATPPQPKPRPINPAYFLLEAI